MRHARLTHKARVLLNMNATSPSSNQRVHQVHIDVRIEFPRFSHRRRLDAPIKEAKNAARNRKWRESHRPRLAELQSQPDSKSALNYKTSQLHDSAFTKADSIACVLVNWI